MSWQDECQTKVQMSNIKKVSRSSFECRTPKHFDKCWNSKQFDVRHSNVKSQNDTNVEHQTVLMFDIQMSKVKIIRMSNVKLF